MTQEEAQAKSKAQDQETVVRGKAIGKTTDIIRLGSSKPLSPLVICCIMLLGLLAYGFYFFSTSKATNFQARLETGRAVEVNVLDNEGPDELAEYYKAEITAAITYFLSVLPIFVIMVAVLLNYPKQKTYKELNYVWLILGLYVLFYVIAGLAIQKTFVNPKLSWWKLSEPLLPTIGFLGALHLTFLILDRLRNKKKI